MSDDDTFQIGAESHVAKRLEGAGTITVDAVDGPVLPGMYEVSAAEAAYETKTLRFHLEERGQYLYVMLTRFDGNRNLLGEMGYGGEYIMFQTMSQNHDLQVCGVDLFAMAEDHPFPLSKLYPFDLLYQLDTGGVPWAAISDGEYLTEADVEAILADHKEVEADAE